MSKILNLSLFFDKHFENNPKTEIISRLDSIICKLANDVRLNLADFISTRKLN